MAKTSRHISERDIAIALVLELAGHSQHHFSLLGFYDSDIDFMENLSDRLNAEGGAAFKNKVQRVIRKLVKYGTLAAAMRGTHKEYFGEPAKQMEYRFASPGKARLLTLGKTEHTNEPEWEAAFLLRRAYPAPKVERAATLTVED